VADDLGRQGVACDLAGDVLTMRFADGTKCTLIRQTPTDQVWLADGVLAWYFDWQADTGDWTDGRGRGRLATILRDVLERRLGSPPHLAFSPAP
jgi:frataxin-like iron-binding protein CyaY